MQKMAGFFSRRFSRNDAFYISETSKSTDVKTGRRKVEDKSEKKTEFSFKKKDKTMTQSQSFLDELGLNVKAT